MARAILAAAAAMLALAEVAGAQAADPADIEAGVPSLPWLGDLPPNTRELLIAEGLPLDGAPHAVVGPYAVTREPAGPSNALFRPADLSAFPSNDTLPVVLWGNGGCRADSSVYTAFLDTIASHGFLVVATAAPAGEPDYQATDADYIAGLDWALAEAARPGGPLEGRIDTDHVAAMGQSCGGGRLALAHAGDPRIDAVGLWNGTIELDFFRRRRELANIQDPTLLIDGGERDVVYKRSQRNYDAIEGVPVFYGSRRDGGHVGTIHHPGGGEFANVAVAWLRWTLKGDEAAGRTFSGEDCGLCIDPNWAVQRKGF